uniref:Putative p53 regulated pa26 nuclear protein sestrin n=1 Tax=Ixodes ricinus TaxID=34613 RepID=A0A0K8R7J8_IXORI
MQVLGKEQKKKKRENTHTMLPGRQQEKETKKDGLSDASVLLPRGILTPWREECRSSRERRESSGEDTNVFGESRHVPHQRPQCIEQFRLHPCFQDHDCDVHLFGVLELPHDVVVVLLGHAVWVTADGLDVLLEVPVQELVDLPVVIVVVPDAVDALDVVPHRPTEHGRVHVRLATHGVVGQVVGDLELLVEQLSHIVVEPVDQGVAVVFPRVVLHPERGDLRHFPPCKVLVCT